MDFSNSQLTAKFTIVSISVILFKYDNIHLKKKPDCNPLKSYNNALTNYSTSKSTKNSSLNELTDK